MKEFYKQSIIIEVLTISGTPKQAPGKRCFYELWTYFIFKIIYALLATPASNSVLPTVGTQIFAK